jgi:hypothetical protein
LARRSAMAYPMRPIPIQPILCVIAISRGWRSAIPAPDTAK